MTSPDKVLQPATVSQSPAHNLDPDPMDSKSPFIAGGGRKYGGKPLTWLFTVLTIFGFPAIILSWVWLRLADSSPDNPSSADVSGRLWLCILLTLTELVLILLAIRFAITEKSTGGSSEPYDPRKLY